MMRLLCMIVAAFLIVYSCQAGKKRRKRVNQCSNNAAFGSGSFKFFGVRTLYRHIQNHRLHQLPNQSTRTLPERCTPVHLYLLARHGARYPHKGTVTVQKKLLNLARKVNRTGTATQCAQDIESLRNWRPWVDEFVDKNQTDYGDLEIRKIARRFSRMLPELLSPVSVSSEDLPRKYRFRSSDYERTRDSMRVFAEEILTRGSAGPSEEMMNRLHTEVSPITADYHLRYLHICRKYQTEVFRNSSTATEYKKFLNGPRMRRVMRSLATRLGLRITDLKPKIVYDMYLDGCALQQWVDARNGPWCSPFSRKDFKLLEYATDLKEFGRRTRKNRVTREMSCILAKDIISSLKDAADADRNTREHPLGTFRFGHVTSVMSVASNLDLFQDSVPPLTAENYRLQRDRSFQTSRMIPSAGNLAFVLYKCGGQYKVQLFWNERIHPIPACPSHDTRPMLCDLDTVLRHYDKFVPGSSAECNFDEICEN